MIKGILGLFMLVFVFERLFIFLRLRKLFEEIWFWFIEIFYLFGMNILCILCMNLKRGIKYRVIKIKKTEFNFVKYFIDSFLDNRWYFFFFEKKLKKNWYLLVF